jgi:hypothetical protein
MFGIRRDSRHKGMSSEMAMVLFSCSTTASGSGPWVSDVKAIVTPRMKDTR